MNMARVNRERVILDKQRDLRATHRERILSPDTRLAKLCGLCQTVVDNWDIHHNWYGLPFHGSIDSWKLSARDCALCLRLLTNSNQLALNRVKDLWREFPDRKMCFKIPSKNLIMGNETIDKEISVEIWGLDDSIATVSVLRRPEIHIPSLGFSTGSETSLRFVKTWLQTCLNLHQPSGPPPLTTPSTGHISPVRLIEISQTSCRLAQNLDVQEFPQYVTLSHCWGGIDMFRLKKESLARFIRDIPIESLCKTFLDAISVVKRLGLRYLWIDSLCIIQDDEEDWRQQSTLMSQIYGNAVANIAASHASSGDDGLFSEQNPLITTRHFINTIEGDVYEIIDNMAYERCLSESRLSTRAWAFQERFLAWRTIHFTAEQIFCECRKETVCESSPWSNISETTLDNPFKGDRATGMADWGNVVMFYSRSRLTYSKDKLVAISGVARYFLEQNADQYVAGLWRRDLERQLCWKVSTEISMDSETQITAYRAPSWSWACHDMPVNWSLGYTSDILTEPDELLSLVEISEVNLVPAGEDDLGQLQNAKLQIVCSPLIRNVRAFVSDGSRRSPDFEIVGFGGPYINANGEIYFDRPTTRGLTDENVYFLPVLSDPNSDPHYPDISTINLFGLILETSTALGKGIFKRVGVFDLVFEAEDYATFMLSLSSKPGTLADDALYEEILVPDENEVERYTITLI